MSRAGLAGGQGRQPCPSSTRVPITPTSWLRCPPTGCARAPQQTLPAAHQVPPPFPAPLGLTTSAAEKIKHSRHLTASKMDWERQAPSAAPQPVPPCPEVTARKPCPFLRSWETHLRNAVENAACTGALLLTPEVKIPLRPQAVTLVRRSSNNPGPRAGQPSPQEKGFTHPQETPTEHAQCEFVSAPPHVSSPGCRARGASAGKEGALLTSPAPPLRLPCSAPASLPSRGWRLCRSELITARKPSV